MKTPAQRQAEYRERALRENGRERLTVMLPTASLSALARLAKSDEAIADIATNLGYADPSTFYRAFMSWTGIAPTTYRERLAQARS